MKTSTLLPGGWVGCLMLLLVPAAIQAAPLKAGVATVDITPPVGWRMSGYFYERLSTNIHDPLQAKALVLEQGREKAVLVFCDLIGISRHLASQVRQTALRKTGIPPENILIAATHTHTGPLYYGPLREHFHEAAAAKSKDGIDPFERLDYTGFLAERLVDVIVRAQSRMEPIQIQAGAANQTGLSFNRRYVMKDGSVKTNPGKTNSNVLRAAGPVDPEVGILALINPVRKKPLATFTSFGLHPDTVGTAEYGADYPYYLSGSLQKVLGLDVVSFFGNGTCGNVNHVDVSNPRPQKGQSEAERIGTNLAASVLVTLPELKALEKPGLVVRSAMVTLALQTYDSNRVEKAHADMAKIEGKDLSFLSQVEACKISAVQRLNMRSLRTEVQVFRLGADTALVGLPGEIFSELGLSIKKASPFKYTFIIELSNDSIHYVPTQQAFAEGGYEPTNAIIAPGGGELLAQTAIDLLQQLK